VLPHDGLRIAENIGGFLNRSAHLQYLGGKRMPEASEHAPATPEARNTASSVRLAVSMCGSPSSVPAPEQIGTRFAGFSRHRENVQRRLQLGMDRQLYWFTVLCGAKQ
jgi:hypothetical protein